MPRSTWAAAATAVRRKTDLYLAGPGIVSVVVTTTNTLESPSCLQQVGETIGAGGTISATRPGWNSVSQRASAGGLDDDSAGMTAR